MPALRTASHLVFLALVASCAFALTPFDYLWRVSYLESVAAVVRASVRTVATAPGVVTHGIIPPIVAAAVLVLPFVPLRVTDAVLKFAALFYTVVFWGALLFASERRRFAHLLQHEPQMGYMWHDAMLTFALAVLNNYPDGDIIWLLLGGPWMCICWGKRTSDVWPPLLLLVSAASTMVAFATMAALVAPDGTLLVDGYFTDSVAGVAWSQGFVVCWIKILTLMARAAYHTISARTRVALSVVALVVVQLSVLLYFSAAWGMYLAFVSLVRLDDFD